MNTRKLNIKKSSRMFDIYSSLDMPVVRQATFYGFALIGGTAVEHWANYYDVEKRRNRSINDLDFISHNENPHIAHYLNWLRKNGFETSNSTERDSLIFLKHKEIEIEVDLLVTHEHNVTDYFTKLGGFLTVSPVYIFIAKVQRLSVSSYKNETDIQDLNTLFDVLKKRNEIELLQDELGKYSLDYLETKINKWLNE